MLCQTLSGRKQFNMMKNFNRSRKTLHCKVRLLLQGFAFDDVSDDNKIRFWQDFTYQRYSRLTIEDFTKRRSKRYSILFIADKYRDA